MRVLIHLLFLSILSFVPETALAQKLIWEEFATNIKVTVKSKDAKFIGTNMGGVHVSVVSKLTGDVLAEGVTYGNTGDTALIMENPERNKTIATDQTADLEFSLALMEPTAVKVVTTGPLAQPQSMVTVSQDYILIPGKDYTSGNGILIELPGLVVDAITPLAGEVVEHNPDEPITILANVRQLCGCDIAEEGHWPADRYEVEAFIFKEASFVSAVPLDYADKSQFATRLKMPQAGTFRIIVTAFDPVTKDSGMDVTTITLKDK
jgi:hypothetical protein